MISGHLGRCLVVVVFVGFSAWTAPTQACGALTYQAWTADEAENGADNQDDLTP